MAKRQYYSTRSGNAPLAEGLDLVNVLKLFLNMYRDWNYKGYFQDSFGIDCQDSGHIPGRLGSDIEGAMLLAIRKPNLWPIYGNVPKYSEDDFFDVVEFLYDHIARPIDEGLHHGWNNECSHYSEFDRASAQSEYRDRINDLLGAYSDGFELSSAGEVMTIPEGGMRSIFDASVPSEDPDNIQARISSAIRKFRRHRSSLEDRRMAIRDLADVLEFLRPKAKKALSSKDEDDLFNIINNFGIRHHNERQRTVYEQAIFYSWLFYYYLAGIHAVLRLIERQERREQP